MEHANIDSSEKKILGKDLKFIISGGGTGGHVFPAIAIADQLRQIDPSSYIHFVGATGKIEMTKVPKAGYPILGLPIRGVQRKWTLKNLSVPLRLISSLIKARKLIKSVKPDVVIGVGGYASFPTLYMANKLGIPTVIQEQNSYAGVANKLLGGRANKYCVAYENMDKYFPKEKIIHTGNPVRTALAKVSESPEEAKLHFGFDPKRPVALLTGGSLGAQNLNEAFAQAEDLIKSNPQFQWLWQVGSLYEARFKTASIAQLPNVKMTAFIDRMDLAYRMSDLIVCRAGALTVSEICLLGKASILIPSPNVAEDHQSKNAMALVVQNAAVMIKDVEAKKKMVTTALELLKNDRKCDDLRSAALRMGKPDATKNIATEIIKLANSKRVNS